MGIESDRLHDAVIGPSQKLIGRMVSKLSRTDREEPSESTNPARALCQLVVEDVGDRSQNNQPGFLDVVHGIDNIYNISHLGIMQ